MSQRYSVFAAAQAALALPLQATDILLVVRAGVPYRMAPGSLSALSYVYAQPVTGATLTAVAGQGATVCDPAGAILALAQVLPPSPVDGQVFEFSTTQVITALTATAAAGDTMAGSSGGPVGMGANSGISWRYRLADLKWYPRS